MKAAILEKYNKNGNDLVIKELQMPEVKETEVLIKIKASGVNPLDNMIIRKEVNLIVPYKLPLIMGNVGLWLAFPISELITFLIFGMYMIYSNLRKA